MTTHTGGGSFHISVASPEDHADGKSLRQETSLYRIWLQSLSTSTDQHELVRPRTPGMCESAGAKRLRGCTFQDGTKESSDNNRLLLLIQNQQVTN